MPQQRCSLDLSFDSPTGGTPVHVGVFVVTAGEARPLLKNEAEPMLSETLAHTQEILAQCDLRLDLEAAQVVLAPASMATVEGNSPTSWGGVAPDGTADADLFNYELGERVVEEPRALFEHARSYLSDEAIAIIIVDDIIYHAAQVPTPAGGLSFAPIVYHHVDDYPLRNAVMSAGGYAHSNDLPAAVNGRTIAHELGHMLLNTAQHEGELDNLMLSGEVLVESQCELMRENLAKIYGSGIIDPLLP
jgi:hypothetical protein